MPGSRKKQSKKKEPLEKEKKGPSPAEIRAENRATGKQGKASAVSVRASYSQSTICGCRMKAEICAEFQAQNKLEMDNAKAWHNRQIYQRFADNHKLKWKEHLHVFWRGQALGEGHPCYSLTKNQLEKAK